MNGQDYVALVRLSTRDDTTLALPGQTCERVNPASLEGLLLSGKIRAVDPPVKRALKAVKLAAQARVHDEPEGGA